MICGAMSSLRCFRVAQKASVEELIISQAPDHLPCRISEAKQRRSVPTTAWTSVASAAFDRLRMRRTRSGASGLLNIGAGYDRIIDSQLSLFD